MRAKMKELDKNTLYSFEGNFVRFGTYKKRHYAKRYVGKKITYTSMLLRNVKLKNGEMITDHVWVTIPYNQMRNIKQGDTVCFTAYVEPYIKGCWGHQTIYCKKLELDYQFGHINILAVS